MPFFNVRFNFSRKAGRRNNLFESIADWEKCPVAERHANGKQANFLCVGPAIDESLARAVEKCENRFLSTRKRAPKRDNKN